MICFVMHHEDNTNVIKTQENNMLELGTIATVAGLVAVAIAIHAAVL